MKTMKRWLMPLLLAACLPAMAETVQVKYHGPVSLDAFTCNEVSEGSDVTRICYDPAERYMVIRLRSTYYHYCEIGAPVVQGLRSATSKRHYFETRIKGNGSDGPFDCRTHPVPMRYRR